MSATSDDVGVPAEGVDVLIRIERADRVRRAGGVCAVEKNARNQVLFREVNEHIAELSGAESEAGVSLSICECGNPNCAESLEITPAEYEQVRADRARFVVLSGHQLPEVERVVDGNGRFLVVENVGAAATIARASDPRQHGKRSERESAWPAAPGDGIRPSAEPLPQFRCAGCGYGACCPTAPDRCPMCGGRVWDDKELPTPESVVADLDHALGREARL